VAAGSFLLLYWPILTRLVQDWAQDDNYSHGFLIVPLALYFVWERRGRLKSLPPAPTAFGLVVVFLGLGLLLAGQLGAELFLTRISIVIVAAGIVLFLLGWRACRVVAFPLAFLLLMIPIPAIIFNQVAFPLQLMASRMGEMILAVFGIPVLREGNLIVLAHTTLEVAEACSGIRSLISLLTLGIVYGYFIDPRGGVRAAIALSTVPIAILTNGARVAGTGLATQYYGAEAALGFFHTFSGWIVFAAAFVMLFGLSYVLVRIAPRRRLQSTVPVPQRAG
jgi:exosortase